MATLADVARRAGVSTATASRIINGSPKPVAEALRERVLAAVAELQYVPNAHAQMLARANRSAVGVIVHDVSDPYFAEITRGLQRVATAHGRLVIICNSYRDPERELEYLELLHAHQVAAIVVAGSGYLDPDVSDRLDARMRAYEATGGRIAVIGRHGHTGDAVLPDNEEGGYPCRRSPLRPGAHRHRRDRRPGRADHHGRPAGRAAPGGPGTPQASCRSIGSCTPTSPGTAVPAPRRSCSPTIRRSPRSWRLNDSMAVGALAALRSAGPADQRWSASTTCRSPGTSRRR